MKLNPPASSSDLDAARELARRLHQRRRRGDRPALELASAAPRRPTGPAIPFETHPAPPSWDEPATRPSDDPLSVFGEPAEVEAEVEVEAEGGSEEDADVPVTIEAETAPPGEASGTTGPTPFAELASPFENPPSPFEELDEPAAPGDAAPPRTWDDVVEECLSAAQARGAMLAGPSGQLVAARGEWPAPGPEAIASKLVATMERTLRDAPTRSISAPLMGQHLTAWRVPLADGLVTVVFIGETPVGAETRPGIDAEIQRGPGV